LGQLLDITQRTICVIHQLSGGRFSPRKLIPVNPKTLGDHLLLKHIEASLSQPEVAVKAGVSTRPVRKWKPGRRLPLRRPLAGIGRHPALGFLRSQKIISVNQNSPKTLSTELEKLANCLRGIFPDGDGAHC
jgi:hypothetical protein